MPERANGAIALSCDPFDSALRPGPRVGIFITTWCPANPAEQLPFGGARGSPRRSKKVYKKDSGNAGFRSRCLAHAKRALYQLSYAPIMSSAKSLATLPQTPAALVGGRRAFFLWPFIRVSTAARLSAPAPQAGGYHNGEKKRRTGSVPLNKIFGASFRFRTCRGAEAK